MEIQLDNGRGDLEGAEQLGVVQVGMEGVEPHLNTRTTGEKNYHKLSEIASLQTSSASSHF